MTWICRNKHMNDGRQAGSICPFCAATRERQRIARILARPPRRPPGPHARYRWHCETVRAKGRLAQAFTDGQPVTALYRLWQDWKTAERLHWLAQLDRQPTLD